MSLTTLLVYGGLMLLGWFLRHRGVFAKDAASAHPALDELEKLVSGRAEAERVLAQIAAKLRPPSLAP
jgi:hypothetical protein